GSSRSTWSWERDPSNFWPPWLVKEAEFSKARIFTFGYNANFTGEYTSLNILDFARDLLVRMETYSGDYYQGDVLIGKAYIIFKSSRQYDRIIAHVSAMVFLATPHRGSAFAAMLNNILKASPGRTAKTYIAELERQSSSLQDSNEMFRNIVEKDSALLEYPGEITSSLIADHHGMAKFKTPQDTNYTVVRDILKWLTRTTNTDTKDAELGPIESHEQSELPLEQRLMNILGISEKVDEELENSTERTMQGSCRWLLQRQAFQDWISEPPKMSGLLWLTGNPGAGKSILASYVIALLKERFSSGNCHFHFFLAAHQTKRTVSYLLRSIALQAALLNEVFCSRLIELHENTGITFGQQKATMIWEKVFEGILFRIPSKGPLFWVLDGLDEAETPLELVKLLSRIKAVVRINVVLLSHTNKDRLSGIRSFLPTIVHETITADDNKDDIREYVTSSIQRILPEDPAQEEIVQEILSKALGSFLWVRLALARNSDNWHTKDDIRAALTEIPEGMGPLYERMLALVADQPPKPHRMAVRILTWVACTFRPLEITELEMALRPDFPDFYNLERTIEEICGHFIVINKSKLTLIHHTAAQCLLDRPLSLPVAIDPHESHQHIATVCIDFLSDCHHRRRAISPAQGTSSPHPNRCVLTEDSMRSVQEGDAWKAPKVALWQPETDRLLIMYEDTKVVEWNVRDDEQLPYDHIGARGMILSQDGSLLLTSDVNGTLSIWTVPHYQLRYRLKYEELVTDMAFLPDGTRFYDICGTFCKVWEPDALVRSQDLDQDNASSHHDTIHSEPVISSDDTGRIPITSLICNASNKFFCCGKEDGTVVMYALPSGKKVRQVANHGSSSSVIKLAWSTSEKYLASGDDSGRIMVKRLEPPSSGKDEWGVFKLLDWRIDEAIFHLMFHPHDSLLLIAGRITASVMSLKAKTELCHAHHPEQRDGIWINHPTSQALLIKVDAVQARQYLWRTLLLSDDPLVSSVDSPGKVQRPVLVRDRWLVLEILSTNPNFTSSQHRHIESLDLHRLHDTNAWKRKETEGLAKHVRRLIGCFHDQVVFVDHQFWLCTWALEAVYSKHKRHFFLPKDWLSPTALRLISLNA
ncbi:MAG: hypothetical protein LQ341_005546, partial [Variospora aurantia]